MKFTYGSGDQPLDGYTIKRPLGYGGFGEVYHAVSDGGKDVAVKLVQRFMEVELRGVKLCLNMKHPNLITIFDVRTNDKDEQWVLMEHMDGPDLARAIDRHPEGMPPAEALRWLRGILTGVEHLHQAGIVHRDLKPSNIFDDNGSVKVGDYGLSKFITASKRSGQTQSIGTVHYMAPEIGSGRYGREVDLYAIGVMLFEMLTGKVPFEGETPTEVLMKHLTTKPDTSGLPQPFQAVVARMLAKRPEDRYSSPKAVLSDLEVRLKDFELHGPADEVPDLSEMDLNAFSETTPHPEPNVSEYPSRTGTTGYGWLHETGKSHFATGAAVAVGIASLLVLRLGGAPDLLLLAATVIGLLMVAWHLARPVADKIWTTAAAAAPPKRSVKSTVGYLLVMVVAGVGLALFSAGLTLELFDGDSRADERAVLVAFGAGLASFLVMAMGVIWNYLGSTWVRLPLVLIAGALCGILTGLIGTEMFRGADEEVILFALGVGTTVAGLLGFRYLTGSNRCVPVRAFPSVLFGVGVGLLAGGVAESSRMREETGVLLGVGAGLLTCGGSLFMTFILRWPKHFVAQRSLFAEQTV